MIEKTKHFKRLLILLLVVSMAACPLAWASQSSFAHTTRLQPFSTLPPQQATFQAVFTATPPAPTPIATLGPGHYFEHDDPNRPPIDKNGMVGDEELGYVQLASNPDLFMVWMTDNNGTHYLVVTKDSDLLTGGTNPNVGFFRLAEQRQMLQEAIALARDEQKAHQEAARDLRWGTIAILGVAAICAIATGGACVPVIAAAAVPFWAAFNRDTEANLSQALIDSANRQLDNDQMQMRFQFKIAQAAGPGG